nr:IS110 family transposase [Rhizobium sp. Khangiran2]
MKEDTTAGLDIAKHVFQVHGVDEDGTTVLRTKIRRAEIVSLSIGYHPV